MSINYINAHMQALGSLRLIPIYLGSPGIVSRALLLGAANEAAQMLGSVPMRVLELADVFRCVNNVIHEGRPPTSPRPTRRSTHSAPWLRMKTATSAPPPWAKVRKVSPR